MNKEKILKEAKKRVHDQSVMDAEDDNIICVLDKLYDETHTHSKIIAYLLEVPASNDNKESFLSLFLKRIDVPAEYLSTKKWTIYRERTFDEGRIDFVLESSEYVVAIEMKLGAGDGSHQLERYDRFCRSRHKEYGLYYLTIGGYEPSEQSAGGIDVNRLHCISFSKDILEWLGACLDITEYGGYKYSLIKQYIGAIRQITDKGTTFGMSDLIKDSETAFAVVELHNELQDKIAAVMSDFLKALMEYLGENTDREYIVSSLDGNEYYFETGKSYPGFYTILDSTQINTVLYRFYFAVEVNYKLYVYFGFDRVKKNGEEENINIDVMRKKDRAFCDRCLERVWQLDIRDLKTENDIYWVYVENTKGEKLDFKHWSDSVIELIDDMDIQVEYIGDYIVNRILKRI